MAQPRSGGLADTPLPTLLLDLLDARFTGALHLARDRVAKRILFRDGSPILGESNLASETLGVQLLDAGKITREDYSKVVGYVQLKSCREGKALLDLKLLDPKGLFVALKDQLRRRIVECFGWPSGEWKLDPAEVPPEDAQAFRLDSRALAQEGIETHWSTDRVLVALGERLGRIARLRADRATAIAPFRPSPGVAELAAALDGSCTLGEAIRRAGAPGALAVAFVLDATGALEFPEAEERPEDAGEAVRPVDRNAVSALDIEVVVEGARAPAGASAAGSPVAGARPASPADAAAAQAIAAEIAEKHGRPDLDHYALLGVPRAASPAVIKRAYFAAAKRFHPDTLARLARSELRQQANELFARIAKAYGVLSDPRARADYDADASGSADGEAERIAQAEVLYRKGEILVRKGAFKEALQFLAPAVELWPEESEYRSALGWALYKQGKSEPEAAREHLAAAVKLDPKASVAHYRLGVVLRALGDTEAAERALARSKQLDPKYKPA